MVSIDLGGTLKTLKVERAKAHQELVKLDKAISVLESLSVLNLASHNGHSSKRTMSVEARKRIAKAQRLRWAKLKQQRTAKN
jgi:hypothetical protein